MNRQLHSLAALSAATVLLTSCASLQDGVSVRDDVYDIPNRSPRLAAAPSAPQREEGRKPHPDDYYDAGEANAFGRSRGFYDMAYNDPHYFNQARFGFGMGMNMGPAWGWGMGSGMGMGMMGWHSGWAGPGWGMGMGWGADPWMSMSYGWGSPWGAGGFNNPWMSPWNDPWGWNRPWGMGMGMGWNRPWGACAWDPWCCGGWGYGGFMGPWGNCFNCYMPVVIGGGTGNTVIGRRPSIASGGGAGRPGGGVAQQRMLVRDPVGLSPISRPELRPQRTVAPQRPVQEFDYVRPNTRPVQSPDRGRATPGLDHTRPSVERGKPAPNLNSTRPSMDPNRQGQPDRGTRNERQVAPQQRREAPQHGGDGFDRGVSPRSEPRSPGGGGFSPSHDGGGRPSPPRPR
jgi:hypothetical protein